MPGWPTGADTRTWMRQNSIGGTPSDLDALNETTAAAVETLRARLDPSLLPVLSGTLTNAALSASVASVTTTAPSGLTVGETVTVSAVPNAVFNGTWLVSAVTPSTFAWSSTAGDQVAASAVPGTFVTVDRCPVAVALACKIRAAALFVRRDSPAGVIRVSADAVIRINRYDSDIDSLLAPFKWGVDPAPELL